MKANNWIASVALASAAPALAATGQAAELVVGQVAPMTGLGANQGRAYAAGMQLLFNDTNAAGGVNGISGAGKIRQ